MRDPGIAQHREQLDQGRRSAANTAGTRSNAGRTAEPRWYGAPRPPNDQPPVGGPLAVDDQVSQVAEGRPVGQADLAQAASGSGAVAIISE